MDRVIDVLNAAGQAFCVHAGRAFVQSSILIGALLVLDLLLRKRVRAVVRYAMWLLVFVKLLLPPTLALPTGIGYYRPHRTTVVQEPTKPIPAPSPAVVIPSSTPVVARTAESVDVPAVAAQSTVAPSPTTEPVRVRPAMMWQAWVFLAWLAGVVVLCICLVRRFRYAGRLVRQSVPASGPMQDVLAQCARTLGLRRCPDLRLSDNAPGPVVCGLLSPVVLMPTELADDLSADRLRAVLVHELAHIKRADLWVNFIQTLLLVAYFYHPLLWLVNAIVRRLREQAVDETVLVALDAEAKGYSTTLIDLAEMTFHRPILGLRLIGIAESRKALEGRIRHMMTRSKPSTARIGLWGQVALTVAAVLLLPMAAGRGRPGRGAGGEGYSILVLDDADPEFQGKGRGKDRLYLLDSEGNIDGAVSGLEVCQTFGGAHVMAIDEARRVLWVAENLGERLSQFDLATGELLRRIPALDASAVAVDPSTGNAWVMISEGTIGKGSVQVVSPSGQRLARYEVSGCDIAYCASDESFWTVGKDVHKLDRQGNILGRITGEIPWTAASVSVDEKTGQAWVVVRDHPDVPASRPELWVVDRNVRLRDRIDLGEVLPFCVAVDSENEVAYVGCLGTTLRYTTRGEKLRSARYVSGFSLAPRPSGDGVIAGGGWGWGVQAAGIEDSGAVRSGDLSDRLNELLSPNQKWVATVPFAGAKLRSSSELADLSRRPPSPEKFAPVSAERLSALGKALLIYANDYEDKFPDTLQGVSDYLSRDELTWLKRNVAYLGKGKTTSADPDTVLAYEKTLLAQGAGTLVLFADSHVDFRSRQELEALAIKAASIQETDAQAHARSVARLSVLGKALLIYANDHNDRFPERLSDLRDELHGDASWFLENVTYLGNKLTPFDNPARVLAYDKTLLERGAGTNVLYLDGRVAFENPETFERLGLAAVGPQEVDLETRVASRTRLSNLGRALLIYANDHEDKLPDELRGIRQYDQVGFSWLYSNVAYIGKGMTIRSNPERPVAYDKTLLEAGAGTNVLYLDSHVAFEKPATLDKLGIKLMPKSAAEIQKEAELQARVKVLTKLKKLAMAAIMFASDNNDRFTGNLEALKPYLGQDEELWVWVSENVEYIGANTQATNARPAFRPVAYCRLAQDSSEELAVAFQDGHVEFVKGPRLKQLGIEIKR